MLHGVLVCRRSQARVIAHGPAGSSGPPSPPCRPFRCLTQAPTAPTPFNVTCATPRSRPVMVQFEVSAGGGARADGSAVRLHAGAGPLIRWVDVDIGVQTPPVVGTSTTVPRVGFVTGAEPAECVTPTLSRVSHACCAMRSPTFSVAFPSCDTHM
jgi:hypothetical protein